MNSSLSSPIVELSWEMVSTLLTTNVKSTISDRSAAKSRTSLLSVSCCFNIYTKEHEIASIGRIKMHVPSKVRLSKKAISWLLDGSTNRTLISDLTIHEPTEIVYIPPQSYCWILIYFRESELIHLNEKWDSCASWTAQQSGHKSIRLGNGVCKKNTDIVWFEYHSNLSLVILEVVLYGTENEKTYSSESRWVEHTVIDIQNMFDDIIVR